MAAEVQEAAAQAVILAAPAAQAASVAQATFSEVQRLLRALNVTAAERDAALAEVGLLQASHAQELQEVRDANLGKVAWAKRKGADDVAALQKEVATLKKDLEYWKRKAGGTEDDDSIREAVVAAEVAELKRDLESWKRKASMPPEDAFKSALAAQAAAAAPALQRARATREFLEQELGDVRQE